MTVHGVVLAGTAQLARDIRTDMNLKPGEWLLLSPKAVRQGAGRYYTGLKVVLVDAESVGDVGADVRKRLDDAGGADKPKWYWMDRVS